jgi:hypothetical protein
MPNQARSTCKISITSGRLLNNCVVYTIDISTQICYHHTNSRKGYYLIKEIKDEKIINRITNRGWCSTS